MSLDDYPTNATPEERAAYKLGRLKEQKATRAQSRNSDKLHHADLLLLDKSGPA